MQFYRPHAITLRLLMLLALSGALAGCRSAAIPAMTTNRPDSAATTPLRFRDIADRAGLRYVWKIEGKRPLTILQTIGNGAAFLDFDSDGWLDILLVGNDYPHLYHNDRNGAFVDVTEMSGLKKAGHWLGVAVGDYDNDGFDDLYLTAYRGGALFHNEMDKKGSRNSATLPLFREVTKQAGIAPQPWSTSAAFADLDLDGFLDLVICNYAVFGPGDLQLCMHNGVLTSCSPRTYKAEHSVVYRNNGDGTFTDRTQGWKMRDPQAGKSLGVAVGYPDDARTPRSARAARPVIALANDEMPGEFYVWDGKHYRQEGESSGTAYSADGNVHGGMGIDWGDYDNDGRLDLFVATFNNEVKALYHNDGGGIFTDQSVETGLSEPALPYVAFGCKFFDADNDGWLDLIVTNGHVQDNIDRLDNTQTYRQPTLMFHNRPQSGRASYAAVRPWVDGSSARPIVGRGLATGDFDNDGRVDALVVDSEGTPLLLHNETGVGQEMSGVRSSDVRIESRPLTPNAPSAGWLGVRLIGTKSNRAGIGARLTIRAGGRTLRRDCTTGGSYMSASDRRVHFGLGAARQVQVLEIFWPSGVVDRIPSVPINRYVTVREGSGRMED